MTRRLRGAAAEQPTISPFVAQRIAHLVTPPAPRRSPFGIFGLAFLGATASLAAAVLVARARPAEAPMVQAESGDQARCQIAGGESPLAEACALGGLPRAKLAMQEMVKRARTRGMKFECRTCHSNETRFDLRDDARMWLSQLLASPT